MVKADANPAQGYAQAIAAALRSELGGSHRAAKVTMRWTGAAERTVKHWLAGTCGPSGPNLIRLLRHSDAVLETVLAVSGRNQNIATCRLLVVRETLTDALQALEAALRTKMSDDQQES